MYYIIAGLSTIPYFAENLDGSLMRFQTDEDAVGYAVENLASDDWVTFYNPLAR